MCQACRRAGSQDVLHKSPGDVHRRAKYAPSVERFIEQYSREYARELKQSEVELLEALRDGRLQLLNENALHGQVREIFVDGRAEYDAVVKGMHIDGADAGREVAIQRHALDISMDLTRDEVIRVLESNALAMSEATTQRIVGDLSEALARGYREGMSIPDIADVLEDEVFEDMRGWESERIARTNVVSGSNKGATEAYRDSGAVGKEWVATSGPRTRKTHREADGQVVPIDGTFVVGGAQADHPGDASLPLDELINCRCTVAPVRDPARLGA
ncbi:phage head morphogenesis protein [Halocalculus aciditolerans]|uniref:Phage head morphogenesis domain-containing protein n=1 Tax=Halocalculus aciditolerans TaxID=1383812 RepID=A0A830F243_9EURY|nr:phage minor head protein [Halocalculus aciditolerans]GGL55091.1 hypothetical protein GCM10009039_11490 [Halocalculus aciditolerans]